MNMQDLYFDDIDKIYKEYVTNTFLDHYQKSY